MSFFYPRSRVALLILATFPLGGCLFRSRVVERPFSTDHLQNADQAQLIGFLADQGSRIKSMQATVDIDTSIGGAKKGKVTDYKEIRGYILLRKPAMLRMIGLLPIVRTRAFDMVSDGSTFRLSVPPKNRFVVGRNDVVSENPQQPLENLRPQVIYDALLLRPINPENEIAVLENDTQTITDKKGHSMVQADYVLDVVRKAGSAWFLARKVIFNRTDLLPHRQVIFDEKGNIVTDAKYLNYKDYDGISFPTQIEITRSQEEYDITLNLLKLEFNKQLTDDQFTLDQPPGAEVVHLGESNSGGSSAQVTKTSR